MNVRTVGQKYKKKKNPIDFNTNYHREIKLTPVIVNCCQLEIDALIFFS